MTARLPCAVLAERPLLPKAPPRPHGRAPAKSNNEKGSPEGDPLARIGFVIGALFRRRQLRRLRRLRGSRFGCGLLLALLEDERVALAGDLAQPVHHGAGKSDALLLEEREKEASAKAAAAEAPQPAQMPAAE